MPTIVTSVSGQEPVRTEVRGKGRSLAHECRDAKGAAHRQRMALGSVRGVFYLDAICRYCGAHFLWVEDDEADLSEHDAPIDRAEPTS